METLLKEDLQQTQEEFALILGLTQQAIIRIIVENVWKVRKLVGI